MFKQWKYFCVWRIKWEQIKLKLNRVVGYSTIDMEKLEKPRVVPPGEKEYEIIEWMIELRTWNGRQQVISRQHLPLIYLDYLLISFNEEKVIYFLLSTNEWMNEWMNAWMWMNLTEMNEWIKPTWLMIKCQVFVSDARDTIVRDMIRSDLLVLFTFTYPMVILYNHTIQLKQSNKV